MKRPIENNSSPGQAVYEPFCGSGTTIIAAEMTGRSCHAIELNPAYVDVAVKRWQAFTGEQAVLAGERLDIRRGRGSMRGAPSAAASDRSEPDHAPSVSRARPTSSTPASAHDDCISRARSGSVRSCCCSGHSQARTVRRLGVSCSTADGSSRGRSDPAHEAAAMAAWTTAIPGRWKRRWRRRSRSAMRYRRTWLQAAEWSVVGSRGRRASTARRLSATDLPVNKAGGERRHRRSDRRTAGRRVPADRYARTIVHDAAGPRSRRAR